MRVGDLVGGLQAAQRDAGDHARSDSSCGDAQLARVLLVDAGGHGRVHDAGADGVDADAVGRERQRGRLDDRDHPGLATRRSPGRWPDRTARRRDDSATNDPPRPPATIRRATRWKTSHVPVRLMSTVRRQAATSSSRNAALRMIPADVTAWHTGPSAASAASSARLHGVGVGRVQPARPGPAARGADRVGHRLGAGHVQVQQCDRVPTRRHRACDGRADAPGRARDDHHPAAHRPSPPRAPLAAAVCSRESPSQSAGRQRPGCSTSAPAASRSAARRSTSSRFGAHGRLVHHVVRALAAQRGRQHEHVGLRDRAALLRGEVGGHPLGVHREAGHDARRDAQRRRRQARELGQRRATRSATHLRTRSCWTSMAR